MKNGLLVLAFVFINAPIANGEPEFAYLMIKSTVLQQDRDQPDWILICRESARCEHFSAHGPVLALEPGTYAVRHIDFGSNYMSANDSRVYEDIPKFELEAGNIYFFGHIQLDRTGFREYKTELLMDPQLIQDACAENREIFEQYPVTNIHNGDKFKLRCDEEAN